MASQNTIELCAQHAETAHSVAQAMIAEVRRIEHKYSRYRDDSILSAINRRAGRQALSVDDETSALLDYAQTCYQLSDGLFDITSGILRRAWNFQTAELPHPEQLSTLRPLIGWSRVHWQHPQFFLPVPGMEIDFGGFGKEYAADRAAAISIELGIKHGFINLGGDVRIVGPQADGSPWRIGIQHPRQPNAVIATIELIQGALATSGDYQRYFDRDGRRYCHVLNPYTGYPVDYWQSVTVTAPLCITAGTSSTIAMLSEDRAQTFLAEQKLRYLAVAADGSVCTVL